MLFPVLVAAKIGVGVGTGKIVVDQPIKAGLIYTLPSLTILNTGDEPSDYGVDIQYHENQTQLKPPKEWFGFEPANFRLEPSQAQVVKIKLTMPLKGVKPGDYFAYLQGYPLTKVDTSGTSVGVAAAAKLYFSVTPANFFVGLYYRVASLFSLYSPWSYVVLAVILAALFIVLLRRFFSFNISFRKK